MGQNQVILRHSIIHFPTRSGVSEVSERANEQYRASKRVSGAGERANGRVSGPVLTSVFLVDPDHSETVREVEYCQAETLLLYGDTRYDSGSFDHGDEETREALWYYEQALTILQKIEAENQRSVKEADNNNNNNNNKNNNKNHNNNKFDNFKLTGLLRAAKMRMGRTLIKMGDFGRAMEQLPSSLRFGRKGKEKKKGGKEEEEGEEEEKAESKEAGEKKDEKAKKSPSHYGTKPGHFETLIIHFPTSKGVSEVSERASE